METTNRPRCGSFNYPKAATTPEIEDVLWRLLEIVHRDPERYLFEKLAVPVIAEMDEMGTGGGMSKCGDRVQGTLSFAEVKLALGNET